MRYAIKSKNGAFEGESQGQEPVRVGRADQPSLDQNLAKRFTVKRWMLKGALTLFPGTGDAGAR